MLQVARMVFSYPHFCRCAYFISFSCIYGYAISLSTPPSPSWCSDHLGQNVWNLPTRASRGKGGVWSGPPTLLMEPLLGTGITGKQGSLQSSFPLRDPRYTTMYTSRGDWCGGRKEMASHSNCSSFSKVPAGRQENHASVFDKIFLRSPPTLSPSLPLPLSSLPLSLSPLSYHLFISLVTQVSPDEKPYDPTVPFWLNVYVAIHFVILLIIATVMRIIRQASFLCTQITG